MHREKIDGPVIDSLDFVLAAYGSKVVYHDFDPKSKKLGAGKPLTAESMKVVLQFLNNQGDIGGDYRFTGLIPCNVLDFKTDDRKIIWYTKPKIHQLLYSDTLSVKSGQYPVPFLLWRLSDAKLSVWALKSPPKKLSDKLYNAPFMNTDPNGLICMGNAKFTIDSYSYEKIITAAESGFFNSIFTHTNNNQLITGNFTEWCNDMVIAEDKEFDNKLLVASGLTLKNILHGNS